MRPFILFCMLLPLFMLVGRCLIAEAGRFIRHIEGVLPESLPFSSLLIILFTVLASWVGTWGFLLTHPWPLVFRNLMLLGWCVLLTQLELARRWLPFRFTVGLILSGLLFSFWSQAPFSLFQAMVDGGLMAGLLSLFQLWVNRHGVERFGQGDVYFLAGLSVWLTFPVTVNLILFALYFLILHVLAGRAGLLPCVREITFTPYLCFSLAVAMWAQWLLSVTGYPL